MANKALRCVHCEKSEGREGPPTQDSAVGIVGLGISRVRDGVLRYWLLHTKCDRPFWSSQARAAELHAIALASEKRLDDKLPIAYCPVPVVRKTGKLHPCHAPAKQDGKCLKHANVEIRRRLHHAS